MAKKQAETTHTAPPAQAKLGVLNEPPGRQKGSWREAAEKELGGKATDQAIADRMNAYASEAGYSWKASAEWVRSKRGKRDGSETRRKRDTATATKTEPTLSDFLAVKAAVNEAGEDSDAFLRTIQTVTALAEKVGGLANLQKCLEALK